MMSAISSRANNDSSSPAEHHCKYRRQILLLGDRHLIFLVAMITLTMSRPRARIGVRRQLAEIDGLDQGAEHRALRFIVGVGTPQIDRGRDAAAGLHSPVLLQRQRQGSGAPVPRMGWGAPALRRAASGAGGGEAERDACCGRSATAARPNYPETGNACKHDATPTNADCYDGRCSSFSISGDNRLELFFFGSMRPVSFCANWRRMSAVR